MNSLFNSANCAKIADRINKLTPESKAVWGKFTVGEMLCHCTDGIKMATGAREVQDLLP